MVTDLTDIVGSLYVTSDLHLDHEKLVENGYRRGHDSIDAMNDTIIDAWNATVGPDDTVLILGDLALGKRREALKLLDRMNGTKILVPGNHDYVWPHHKAHKDRWVRIYGEHVTLAEPGTYQIAGRLVEINHFPYGDLDHRRLDEGRYLEHRPIDNGLWLWHGHVHGEYGRVHHGRQIDVGYDAWGRPVAVEELLDLMDTEDAQAA